MMPTMLGHHCTKVGSAMAVRSRYFRRTLQLLKQQRIMKVKTEKSGSLQKAHLCSTCRVAQLQEATESLRKACVMGELSVCNFINFSMASATYGPAASLI